MKNLILTLHPGKGWALLGHWKEHQRCCHLADNQSHTCQNNPPIYQPNTLGHKLGLLHHLFKNITTTFSQMLKNSLRYWLLFKIGGSKNYPHINHSWHLRSPTAKSTSTGLWDRIVCRDRRSHIVSFSNATTEFTFIDTCSVTWFGVQTCCDVTVELGKVAIFRNHCNINKITKQ